MILFLGISTVPRGTDSTWFAQPGTMSLANFQRRFATVENARKHFNHQTIRFLLWTRPVIFHS
jgi:hypothetical protein